MRKRDRQTERDRYRDRETDRQTDRDVMMQAVKSKQRALPFFISSSSLSVCLFPVCDVSQKKLINEIVCKLLANIDFRGRREANFSVLRHFFSSSSMP